MIGQKSLIRITPNDKKSSGLLFYSIVLDKQ